MLDNFDKADTLAFLWETRAAPSTSAIAGISPSRVAKVLPTCVSIDDVREYARRPIAAHRDERAQLDERWHDNSASRTLRDAPEVERRRVTVARRSAPVRLAPDERRVSSSMSRASSSPSAASTHRRWTTSHQAAGCHEARLHQHFASKRALSLRYWKTSGATARGTHPGNQQRPSTGRARWKQGFAPTSGRRRRSRGVPPPVRRVRRNDSEFADVVDGVSPAPLPQ